MEFNESWKNSKRYNPKVLIGNWYEEQDKLQHNSSLHRVLPVFSNAKKIRKPNCVKILLLRGKKARAGFTVQNENKLFSKQSMECQNNFISWYDQNFNRKSECNQTLREWSPSSLKWVPEKNDLLLHENSTNYGLIQNKKYHIESDPYTSEYTKEFSNKCTLYN
ncbi:hypothetical protein A3Q56_01687 [Intoshia linei]|uniref:Uncharacterized protein n=1 Tax=Intoshia linei TaxID=1819745 RepID=A0A177BAN0_9BILA|nr:hypothetical protein A3Q56_01687 [Intoshia linei]